MSLDTCTACSNSDNLTSTIWKEVLAQLKQESNNNTKNTIEENNTKLTNTIEEKVKSLEAFQFTILKTFESIITTKG